MSETQRYKISHETKGAALFALRARVIRIEEVNTTSADPSMAAYWVSELKKAKDAIAELEAL
jgi:hypothetical protein